MRVNLAAILMLPVALLASPPCTAQFAPSPWPAGTKEAAIAACRESILQQAEQDLLKRNNLKEPAPDLREKLAAALQPFLAVCQCAMDRIEKEWSFDYFASHQAETLARLERLTVTECAPASRPAPEKAP